MTVTAARNFTVCTKDGKPAKRRSFVAGEEVPPEWVAVISGESLLNTPEGGTDGGSDDVTADPYADDPYPGSEGATEPDRVDKVLAWVTGPDDAPRAEEEQRERAQYALNVETEAGTAEGRTTLVTPLRELIGTTEE